MIALEDMDPGNDVVVFDADHVKAVGGFRYGTDGTIHSHDGYGMHSHRGLIGVLPHESRRKREFRVLVREILAEGRVPFPTELVERMGWRGQTNMISGHYSGIRIEELEAAGYVKNTRTGKWVRP